MENSEFRVTILNNLDNKNIIEDFFNLVNKDTEINLNLEYENHLQIGNMIICNAQSKYGKVQFKFHSVNAIILSFDKDLSWLNLKIDDKYEKFMSEKFGKRWNKIYKEYRKSLINSEHGVIF